MEDLVDLKKTLKGWESKFLKENERKPGKSDIDAAPEPIRDAYAQYTFLKKRGKQSDVSESSTNRNVSSTEDKEGSHTLASGQGEGEAVPPGEPPPDVWGKQFDRRAETPGDGCEPDKASDASTPSKSYLQKLGSKMFQQSQKLGRTPTGSQKSSSMFSRKAFSKPAVSQSQSSEAKDSDVSRPAEQRVPGSDSVLPAESSERSRSFSADCSDEPPENPVTHKILESDSCTINLGGLFQKAHLISRQKVGKCSDDKNETLFGKFQGKSKQKQKFLPQKLSAMVSVHRQKYAEEGLEDEDGVLDNRADEVDGEVRFSQKIVRESVTDSSSRTADVEMGAQKRHSFNDDQESYKQETCVRLDAEPEKSGNFHDTQNVRWPKKVHTAELNKEIIADTDSEVSSTRGRSQKTKAGGRKSRSAADDTAVPEDRMSGTALVEDNCPDGLDNIDNEDENYMEKPKTKKRKGASVAPAAKKRKINQDVMPDHPDGEEELTKTKPVKKAPPRSKPVTSGNFVRLNMKVKTYRRKGKCMSGPAHKRMMWKHKMQSRSKSYGDNCFKCGQAGHWANKCPGNKSGGKAMDKEPVADEDFPSMQEAAMLARGVKIESKPRQPVQKKTTPADTNDLVDDMAEVAMETEDVELSIQSGIVRSKPEEAPPPPAMEPLLAVKADGTLPDTPASVMKGLKKFGFSSFRPGQEEAVMRILCGLSTLVVLSTGGGKSLCYQLPAYLYAQRSKCICLVVSPLVSLMEDQVTGLPQGVRGVCLHTNMTAAQKEGVLSAVKEGKAQFLLVSPEAVAGGGMSLLHVISSLPPIAFVCIDEAHCLSEWSHNFRPSYLRLSKVLQDKFGVQCFLGLTATATLSTAADVARHLKISDFEQATIRGSPIPSNLFLSVSRDDNKDEALVGLLKGDRFTQCQSIIIYCTRRDQTDRVATLIRTCLNTGAPIEAANRYARTKGPKLEWEAESYHAGLSPAQRKRVQNNFMAGRLRVVVATVAFGMGLDKSDVRGIIHYNMPKSFESYVQEIGRAGRDGEPAQCHVFIDTEGADLCELRRHTHANTVDYRTLKKLVQLVFPPCRCRDVQDRHAEALKDANEMAGFDPDTSPANNDKTGERICPGHERALPIEGTVMQLDVKEEGISTLLCYLELHTERWVENLSNVYANCRIQCYGGPGQLQAVAKKCPPVAVAIAKARKDGRSFGSTNEIQFPVVDVSDMMGWDSGPVKKELKLLQWSFNNAGGPPSRSGVMVEFTELAFHVRSPGDLTTDELDDVLQFLHERVQRQERTELRQLSRLHQSLRSVSHRHHWMCCDELDMVRNDKLKVILNDYFEHQTTKRDADDMAEPDNAQTPEFNRDQVVSDIRQFYSLYGREHALNGRVVARIFHGIASPCFPATTWGRVRRFWRAHLNADFNELMKLATKELIQLR